MTTDIDTEQRPARRRRRWVWPVLGILVGSLLGLAVLYLMRPHVYAGVVLQSSEPAPAMDGLMYEDGAPVDIEALQGDVVFVYFGYTHCPDVCPLTLGTVDDALDGLGDDAQRVTTIMVTVDPMRDTPEVLDAYVANFDETFRGVWGEEPDIRSVATQYGVTYEYEEEGDDGSYLVAHTASLLAIDPEGALRIVYPFGVSAEALTADLRELLG
ncbi:MAG: SCO family protein [Acidimicrobiia bacterium]|jgi:protein SCO1/2